MTTALLEQLAAQETAAAQKAHHDYRQLVATLATDADEPDPSTAQAILEAAGKTSGDLFGAIQTRRRRNGLRAQLAAVVEARKEEPSLRAGIAAAKAKLDEAKREFETTARPLGQRLAEINQLALQAIGVDTELRRGCDDPDVLSRVRRNQNALSSVRQQLKAASDHLEKLHEKYETARDGTLIWGMEKHGLQGQDPERARIYAEMIEPAEKEVAALQSKITELQAESAVLAEAMIEA